MADEIDVKIRADSGQAATAVNAFADTTESATDRVMQALSEVAAQSAVTAARFSASLSEMSAKARESSAQMVEGLEGVSQRLNGVTKLFALVGEVALGAEAGRQLIELASHYEEFSEQLEHFSERIGVSVERLQALQFAAHSVGISNEEFAASLQHLSLMMTMAEGGGQRQIAVFKQLGLNVAELKAMKPDEVLLHVAQAFATHSGYAEKAAISSELFGRMAGPQLVNLLNQGEAGIDALMEKARELGVVMSEEDVEKGAALKSEMDEIRAVMESLKLQIGEAVAPALLEMAKGLVESAKDGGVLHIALEGLRIILETIAVIGRTVGGTFDEMRIRFSGLVEEVKAAGDFLSAPITNIEGAWNTLVKRHADINAETDRRLAESGKSEQDFIDRTLHTGNYAPFDERASTSKLRQHQGATPDAGKPNIGAPNFGGGAGKGAAELAAAQAAAELARLKEGLQEQARANQDAYKAGTIDLRQYYATRLEIEQSGLKDEIAAKQKEQKQIEAIKPKDAAEALQLQAKLVTVKGQIDVLNMRLADSGPRAAREEALALRELSDALSKIAAQKTLSIGTQTIAQEKTLLDERLALHQITKQQEIASEVDLENQRFALQKNELQAELALAQGSDAKHIEQQRSLNAQIEEAQAEHESKMTELAAQGAEEQAKYQVEAVQSVDDAFSTMFEHIAEGHETLRKIFLDFANTVQQAISKIMAKSLTEKLLGGGTQGGSMLDGLLKMMGMGGTSAGGGAGGGTTPLMGLGGGMQGAVGDWMKSAGLGASGQITAGSMTVASMQIGAIPQATVANMTVANMIAPGGGGSGGGMGDMIGSLMGGSGGNTYGFSLEGTGAEMSAADTAGGMALPAGLGGVGAGIAMYAQGTNYVPETQLAILHKGEAVVPSRYNKPNPSMLSVTNHFSLGQATDLRTQTQIATLAASSLSRAARRNG